MESTSIKLHSPYLDSPSEPIELGIIWVAKPEQLLKQNISTQNVLDSIQEAFKCLEPEEMNRLTKVIVAPNKAGFLLNFALKKV